MEAGFNLLDRILDWLYLRFFRWRELKGLYESAVRQAKGDKALKRAAREILRSDFFDDFVK